MSKTIKQLTGMHHVTAITSSAPKIYDFFTNILGMRLVKKNVNQDDLTSYHLFFADDRGNPGTDMTFFDFKGIAPHAKGTNDISKTSFRVKSDEAIQYWEKRLNKYEVKNKGITTLFGNKIIEFEDFDKQQYVIISDEHDTGVAAGEPWHKGPVPDEYAIVGLGPSFLTVADSEYMHQVMSVMLHEKTQEEGNYSLYETGAGGNGGSIIVEFNNSLPQARQGYGGVHHIAFRVDDREHLDEWEAYFNSMGLPNSGFVDRFYFKSVYIRLYPNILFELATDGPGFIDDQEEYEILGETLTLPPHLRDQREFVEAHLPHFDTVRSTKVFEKEYL